MQRPGWLGGLMLLSALGCGGINETELFPGVGRRVCYLDTDCVPNDCCGRGTGVVHVEDAPSCASVECDGRCPVGTVDCGCGLPHCSDAGQCEVAYTLSQECS